MHNSKNISWSRVLVGGVAIIAGSFLVFVINTWWQDRNVGFEEQKVLQGLKEEFTSLREVLTWHLAEQLRTRESLENVMLEIENGPSEDAGPVVDSALLEMTSPTNWDRDDSVLGELLSSGRTENLTNSTLRARLSAWDRVIEEFRGDQEIANNMVYETHIPYFVSKDIAVGELAAGPNGDRLTLESSISNDPAAIRQLLEDSKFHVLTEVRYHFKGHLIVEIEAAIAAVDEILAEIEKSTS